MKNATFYTPLPNVNFTPFTDPYQGQKCNFLTTPCHSSGRRGGISTHAKNDTTNKIFKQLL
nr:MAG TPA: hypothetical protein [Bacteriophage sp.]